MQTEILKIEREKVINSGNELINFKMFNEETTGENLKYLHDKMERLMLICKQLEVLNKIQSEYE